MDSGRVFEEAFRTLEKKEVAVIRNVHGFPERDMHIISPYLTLLICHSGSSRALYDMQEVVFRPNEVAMVLPNHIISPIERSPDYSTTIIMHSLAFEQEMTRRRMTHDRNKFHKLPACLLTDEEMGQYMQAVELLEIISNAPVSRFPHRHDMLLSQTDIMTEMLDAFRRELDENTKALSHHNVVFNDFCNLLATHYREQHEVAFYAEKAHLTTRHFSVVIKEVVGLSASDYIEQYLATQAKNLLSSRPDLSVLQIGEHLGYADASSFCRFFKRLTGMTPNDFRQRSALHVGS
ncbi:MAG: AraC family transcriptional regulator [Paludibacteraceae bacterium]|nr:AraC family transcriptional regulator [Paludibacteraceae bacterium]